MKLGDLLLVKPGSRTQPGTRYSQGIVVESQPHHGVVMVRWYDCMLHLENIETLSKYYVRISDETR